MKEKCRCYINAKYYAKVAKTGKETLRGYKPCPIHEIEKNDLLKKGARMKKIFIVIAEFKGTIERVIPCINKEVADNAALDCIEDGLEVATYEEEIRESI